MNDREPLPERFSRHATFSADGSRRYLLTRATNAPWLQRTSTVGFVMLNPSKADAVTDDPTVRKCIGFAKRWNFTGLMVTNLIPLVTADPYDLPPWSGLYQDNDRYVAEALKQCAKTVVAWGSVPRSLARSIALEEHILHFRELAGTEPLFCIGRTLKGDPLHPSRTAYTSQMQRWNWER